MQFSEPYLSIVATSRNDNHGGDLLLRMQHFIDGIAEQCDRYKLPAELIIVEWNPPADRPGLKESLKWPESQFCDYRIIIVPSEVHNNLEYAERLPMFQMIAKNVGIRRARGKFVLATNIDILFANDLIEEIARQELDPNKMYRTDRYDAEVTLALESTIDEKLALCEQKLVRSAHRWGFAYYNVSPPTKTEKMANIRRRIKNFILHPNILIGLLLRKRNWFALQVYLCNVFEDIGLPGFRKVWAKKVSMTRMKDRLHTNACGDFTLLSKDKWFELMAYPELQMYSFHIDSLFCYMADVCDVKEHYWSYNIYHLEHGGGWNPDTDKEKQLWTNLSERKVGRITDEELYGWVDDMERDKKPFEFNTENWGYGSATFAEEVIPHVTPALSPQ